RNRHNIGEFWDTSSAANSRTSLEVLEGLDRIRKARRCTLRRPLPRPAVAVRTRCEGKFRLLSIANLLAEIALVSHLADLMKLSFQRVDVLLFALEQALEKLAGRVVSLFARNFHGVVVHDHRREFQLEIALELRLDVLANGKLH